ncbi:MAG TPA: dihydroneopterin aldolase [Gammaproteobacteria bacterium]|nr:dihydroneopterin aldolase [Gammaproteobacteria bacterium]HAU06467.1 dihydroneopterin aldolase [Gammaproteobacteria bacterium]
MDTIFLHDVAVETVIGIYEWERKTTQTLQFDLAMDWDIKAAAASDDIADALDYGAVCQALVAFVSQSRYQLIEALAEATADHLLQRFPMTRLVLTLSKPIKIHGHHTAKIRIERY